MVVLSMRHTGTTGEWALQFGREPLVNMVMRVNIGLRGQSRF